MVRQVDERDAKLGSNDTAIGFGIISVVGGSRRTARMVFGDGNCLKQSINDPIDLLFRKVIVKGQCECPLGNGLGVRQFAAPEAELRAQIRLKMNRGKITPSWNSEISHGVDNLLTINVLL